MFASGTGPLVLWLAAITLLLVTAAGIVIAATDLSINGNHESTLGESVWLSLLRTLDPGTMGQDEGWRFRVVSLVVTLGGILIVSTLIGVLAAGIDRKLADLRRGRSLIVERNHVVILGWSPKGFTVLRELASANENQRDACVVILSDGDKAALEDEVSARLGDLRPTRVVCRTGDPATTRDLDLVSVGTAKSVIVLSPERDNADASVIRTVLALANRPGGIGLPVVAELNDHRNAVALKSATDDAVITLVSSEIVSRITAQVCREAGASNVYQELLDFDGDELYFQSVPQLEGVCFGEALTAFQAASVIGLRYADATIELAPSMSTIIGPGDAVLAIAQDDVQVVFTGLREVVHPQRPQARPAVPRRPEHILVLGWNLFGPFMLRELDAHVPTGSTARIVVDPTRPEERNTRGLPPLENLEVQVELCDVAEPGVLGGLLDARAVDHVVALCYQNACSADAADAQVLMTLLALRHELDARSLRPGIVAELRDVRDVALAGITRADDFVVSERLTSLVIAQLAESPELDAVFTSLFGAGGPDVRLLPARDYLATGTTYRFEEVVAAGRSAGFVVIGYRRDSASEPPVVNPSKTKVVSFEASDDLLVVTRA
jgi:voltage-gated potassium channel Kch